MGTRTEHMLAGGWASFQEFVGAPNPAPAGAGSSTAQPPREIEIYKAVTHPSVHFGYNCIQIGYKSHLRVRRLLSPPGDPARRGHRAGLKEHGLPRAPTLFSV